MRIFLSLGTNLGHRLTNLNEALLLISNNTDIKVLSKSKVYETSPMENKNQDYFLNQVIEIKTKIEPIDLLNFTQKIESKMGREKHSKKYQPRIIDIDILSYNKLILDKQNLCIPHSKIKFRKFILKPWTDISPNYILPNSKSTIKELLERILHLEDKVSEYN